MRVVGIDFLRGVAAFGIVGCHLSLDQRTDGGHLVTALCDFNVGLFAVVAGFLMCGGYDKGRLAYVGKRARRLLPIYFAWSAVFILVTAAFDLLLDGGCLNPRYETTSFWWRVIFLGGSATHLWFLICLFYAQVILQGAFRICANKWHGVLWIALGGVAAFASAMSPSWFNRYPLRLTGFLMTGYGIGCILQGGILEVCKRFNGVIWCVAVVVLVAHVIAGRSVHGFVKDWFAVGPVLLAFVGWEIKSGRLLRVVTILGATSMGVYLVHPLVTRGLSVVVTRAVQPPYMAWVVLDEWLLAWTLSFAAALALRRVPMVRRVV